MTDTQKQVQLRALVTEGQTEDMTRREKARRHQLRAAQARLLMSARPEDCARVSQLLGGDLLMAAHTLLDHDCDVAKCCKWLNKALERLGREMHEQAKQRTPVDTGALRQSTRTR